MGSLLPDDDIKELILVLTDCATKKGLNLNFDLDIDFSLPGLINTLRAIIETLEEGIKEALGIIGKLVEIAKIAVEALLDPSLIQEVLDKIAQFKQDINDAIEDAIGFIVEKILAPVIKNFALPLNLIVIPGLSIKLPGLPNLDFDLLLEYIKTLEFIEKLSNFLLIPIKTIIEFFKSIIDEILSILSNALVNLPKFLEEFLKNPAKWFLDFMLKAFIKVIDSIVGIFSIIDLGDVIDTLTLMINDLFSFKFKGINYYIKLSPNLDFIKAPLIFITCIISMVLTLLPTLLTKVIPL